MQRTNLLLMAMIAASLLLGSASGKLTKMSTVKLWSPAILRDDSKPEKFLEERIGGVSLINTPNSLSGNVVFYSIGVDDDCSTEKFVKPSDINGKFFVFLSAPSDCNSELDSIASELQHNMLVSAVFIQADVCLCSEDGKWESAHAHYCKKRQCVQALRNRATPSEADSETSIPVFVISRLEFDRVHDCVDGGKRTKDTKIQGKCATDRPQVMLDWQVPLSSEFSLYTSSNELPSEFKSENFMEYVAHEFDEVVGTLNVFPYVLDGTQLSCSMYDSECTNSSQVVDCTRDQKAYNCSTSCAYNGRYCVPSEGRATGKQIVEENLRMVCALEGQKLAHWFRYIYLIQEECLGKSDLTVKCSELMHGRANLDFKKTRLCVQNSADGSGTNKKLEKFKTTIAEYESSFMFTNTPTFAIGGVIVPFGLQLGTILSSVCVAKSKSDGFCGCLLQGNPTFEPLPDETILANCFDAGDENNSVAFVVGATMGVGLTLVFLSFVACKTNCFRAIRGNGAIVKGSVEMTDVDLTFQAENKPRLVQRTETTDHAEHVTATSLART